MRVDKDKLTAMMSKDDDALWREIREIAGSHGFKLPESTPPKEDMRRLRGTVEGGTRINLGDAMKIINSYKRGMKK